MTRTEYNDLVDTISDRLLRYALKLTKEYNWSQDLVQESFAKLWINRAKVTLDYVPAFLYKVLYNNIVDDKRKYKTTLLQAKLPDKSGKYSYEFEYKDLIDKAFDVLEVKQKQIIMLRDWQGYSYKEIGEILEYNESLVKVQLFRARKKMRSIIKEFSLEEKSYNENQ